jgi:hypothetical protein
MPNYTVVVDVVEIIGGEIVGIITSSSSTNMLSPWIFFFQATWESRVPFH